ncbi:MAG: 6-phosphogluconolactonase [Labilithrix sp.]|nr:6-phosphogluconolactonase [Labilithrix sp.]
MRAAWLLSIVAVPACFASLAQGCSSDDPAPSNVSGGGDGGSDAALADGAPPRDAGVSADASDAATKPAGPVHAFVGSSDGKIRTYLVDDATGGWTLRKESAAGQNPSFLAFDPARRRVVAVDENASLVRGFAFDPATGALTPTNTQPSGGAGPAHVSLDPTGAFVMVANYTGGTMAVFPIDPSGAIGAASDTRASGAMSHYAATDPSGDAVFVPALGANHVAQYRLDRTTGKLTDNGTAAPPAGSGPRHLSFHPGGKWAYLVNETASTVTTFDHDKATARLTAKQTISALAPGQPTAGVSGAEIFVHPNGKLVYASTRGFDAIALFTIDPGTGMLTRVSSTPTGNKRPRSFGIDPDGTRLYAGNQDANEVVGFAIDPTTGALTSLGKTASVNGPAFVGLIRMP